MERQGATAATEILAAVLAQWSLSAQEKFWGPGSPWKGGQERPSLLCHSPGLALSLHPDGSPVGWLTCDLPQMPALQAMVEQVLHPAGRYMGFLTPTRPGARQALCGAPWRLDSSPGTAGMGKGKRRRKRLLL